MNGRIMSIPEDRRLPWYYEGDTIYSATGQPIVNIQETWIAREVIREVNALVPHILGLETLIDDIEAQCHAFDGAEPYSADAEVRAGYSEILELIRER